MFFFSSNSSAVSIDHKTVCVRVLSISLIVIGRAFHIRKGRKRAKNEEMAKKKELTEA